MSAPDKQPPMQFLVRDAWDTGHEDHLVETLPDALRLRDELAQRIAKEHQIFRARALEYVTVHAVVRMDV